MAEYNLEHLYVASAVPSKFSVFDGEVEFMTKAIPSSFSSIDIKEITPSSILSGSDLSVVEQEICTRSDVFVQSKGSTWVSKR
jgi:hypothetical protein